jgi:hypothetical protein
MVGNKCLILGNITIINHTIDESPTGTDAYLCYEICDGEIGILSCNCIEDSIVIMLLFIGREHVLPK